MSNPTDNLDRLLDQAVKSFKPEATGMYAFVALIFNNPLTNDEWMTVAHQTADLIAARTPMQQVTAPVHPLDLGTETNAADAKAYFDKFPPRVGRAAWFSQYVAELGEHTAKLTDPAPATDAPLTREQVIHAMAQDIVRLLQERFNTTAPGKLGYHELPQALWLALQSLYGPMGAVQIIRCCSINLL